MVQNLTNAHFNSFFWAGFECTYALKKDGTRMDLLAETKHDKYCQDDYKLIKAIGIKTAREGLAWHQVDNGRRYDFSRFEEIMEIGRKEGIQQIWDLNHFDYPEYLDPLSSEFVSQFAKYAKEAIKVIRKFDKGKIYIVPINEISFFSWIGAEIGRWAPFLTGKGWEFKLQLVKASEAAMKEIRKVDNNVEFIQVDPLVRRIPNARATPEVHRDIAEFNINRFQTWDMLSQNSEYLGINYYYFNQEWVMNDKLENGEFRKWGVGWETPNRVSLAVMLKEVWDRYKKPLVISETGGWGEYRWKWWQRIIKETREAIAMGVPVLGVCAYPAVDRPDWEGGHLTNSGLWDFENEDLECRRIPHARTIEIIRKSQLGKL